MSPAAPPPRIWRASMRTLVFDSYRGVCRIEKARVAPSTRVATTAMDHLRLRSTAMYSRHSTPVAGANGASSSVLPLECDATSSMIPADRDLQLRAMDAGNGGPLSRDEPPEPPTELVDRWHSAVYPGSTRKGRVLTAPGRHGAR